MPIRPFRRGSKQPKPRVCRLAVHPTCGAQAAHVSVRTVAAAADRRRPGCHVIVIFFRADASAECGPPRQVAATARGTAHPYGRPREGSRRWRRPRRPPDGRGASGPRLRGPDHARRRRDQAALRPAALVQEADDRRARRHLAARRPGLARRAGPARPHRDAAPPRSAHHRRRRARLRRARTRHRRHPGPAAGAGPAARAADDGRGARAAGTSPAGNDALRGRCRLDRSRARDRGDETREPGSRCSRRPRRPSRQP